MKNYRIIEVRKNGCVLVFENFLYRIDKRKENAIYYKCRTKQCPARGILSQETDHFEMCNGEHNHENDKNMINKLETKTELKQEATQNPTKSMTRIYNEVTTRKRKRLEKEGCEDVEIALSLPSFGNCKTGSYSARKDVVPNQPQSRADIVLTDSWALLDNQDFIMIDSGTEDRILGFGTQNSLKKLCEADRVFMDGTFSVCPKLFAQLYTLHVVVEGKSFPLLYVLLPDKKTITYVRLFELVKEKSAQFGHMFDPKLLTTDFEQGVIQAIKRVFPASSIKCCYFHFTQSIWRKTQEFGLSIQFHQDKEVFKFVKRISALALVPEGEIDDAWMEIHASAPIYPGTVKLADYFVKTYLDDGALFHRTVWCVHGMEGRTNNSVEGWHSGFTKIVGKIHPNIYEFLLFVKEDFSHNETKMIMLLNKQDHPNKKLKYIKVEENVKRLTKEYLDGARTILKFLDAVSRQFRLQAKKCKSSSENNAFELSEDEAFY